MADADAIEVETFQTTEFAQSLGLKGHVNFCLGQPSPKLLSLGNFTQAFEQAYVKTERHPTLLSYADPLGYNEFRTSLAAWLTRRYGFDVHADEICMTNGNSHAMDFAVRLLVDAHVGAIKNGNSAKRQTSYIAMDDPTYFLAGAVVRRYVDMANFNGLPASSEETKGQTPLLTLRMCATREKEGFDVDAFEAWLAEIYGRGQSLLAIYMIPVFQNPTGTSLTAANARRVVALAQQYGFYILSDEPYPFLRFDAEEDAVMSLSATEHALLKETNSEAPRRVLAMGSFSKIFAPGLRLGWIHADPKIIQDLMVKDPVLDSGGGVNPVAGVVMRAMLDAGVEDPEPDYSLDKYISNLVPVLADRCAKMGEAIKKYFSPEEATFNQPRGGYFMWLRLLTKQPGFTTRALRAFVLAEPEKYRLNFLPGPNCRAADPATAFDAEAEEGGDGFVTCLRMSFAFYEAHEIQEGIRRLRVAYDAFLATLA